MNKNLIKVPRLFWIYGVGALLVGAIFNFETSTQLGVVIGVISWCLGMYSWLKIDEVGPKRSKLEFCLLAWGITAFIAWRLNPLIGVVVFTYPVISILLLTNSEDKIVTVRRFFPYLNLMVGGWIVFFKLMGLR